MRLSFFGYLSIFSILFIIIFGYSNLNKAPDIGFVFTNLLINIFLIYKLLTVSNNLSVSSIINIFILFFFGLSPIYQLNNDFYTWGTYLTKNEILISNILILLILLLLHLTTRPFSNKESLRKSNLSLRNDLKLINYVSEVGIKIKYRSQLLLLISTFLLFLYFFSTYNFNFINILYRFNDSDLGFNGNATFYLFISYFVRPLIFNSFLVYLFCKNKNKIFLTIFLFLAIISVFPTGVPRFFAASMYLTFFYIIILKYFKLNFSLLFVLTIGLIFIFPFLDLFRWFTSDDKISSYTFNLDLASGNFDAYGMFTLAISRGTIVYGNNIFSALFFFVPRFLWPNKEIGSGAKISGELNLSLDNISMPYFAEGYLCLGLIGLLFFTFLLSRISYNLDKQFYKNLYEERFKSNPIFLISYLNIIFLFFFIMRGDLLSSYAYLFGISFSNFILYKFSKMLF